MSFWGSSQSNIFSGNFVSVFFGCFCIFFVNRGNKFLAGSSGEIGFRISIIFIFFFRNSSNSRISIDDVNESWTPSGLALLNFLNNLFLGWLFALLHIHTDNFRSCLWWWIGSDNFDYIIANLYALTSMNFIVFNLHSLGKTMNFIGDITFSPRAMQFKIWGRRNTKSCTNSHF